eukprot:scaffold87865_cov64-Cyclotella_meneghiniana.AAC.6
MTRLLDGKLVIGLDEQGVLFGDDIQYHDPELHNNVVRVEYVIRTNIDAECYCAAELQDALDIERNKMLGQTATSMEVLVQVEKKEDASQNAVHTCYS